MNLYLNDNLMFAQTSEYLSLNGENDNFNLLNYLLLFSWTEQL